MRSKCVRKCAVGGGISRRAGSGGSGGGGDSDRTVFLCSSPKFRDIDDDDDDFIADFSAVRVLARREYRAASGGDCRQLGLGGIGGGVWHRRPRLTAVFLRDDEGGDVGAGKMLDSTAFADWPTTDTERLIAVSCFTLKPKVGGAGCRLLSSTYTRLWGGGGRHGDAGMTLWSTNRKWRLYSNVAIHVVDLDPVLEDCVPCANDDDFSAECSVRLCPLRVVSSSFSPSSSASVSLRLEAVDELRNSLRSWWRESVCQSRASDWNTKRDSYITVFCAILWCCGWIECLRSPYHRCSLRQRQHKIKHIGTYTQHSKKNSAHAYTHTVAYTNMQRLKF